MQEEVPAGEGGMAAILGMDAETIDKNIEEFDQVQVANYNCPGQIVISGETEQVKKAADKLKEAGARRAVLLNVSGPFHSSLLTGAGEKLQKVLDERGHELWFEGVRRSDLIRHGQFIQNARDRGCTTTKDEFVLFPLPQAVINEGKGKIIQNPGY